MAVGSNRARNLQDVYPLTKLQMGILFHGEYNPDMAMYHDIVSYHLQAPFNQEAWQLALHDLIKQHGVLRTSFDLTSFSKPIQIVHRQVNIPFSIVDLTHLSFSEQVHFIDEWFEAEKKVPFDWKYPPLIRFKIHRRSLATFQVTATFHHAILDGWSVAVMFNELFQRYCAHLGLTAPALKLPQTTYRHFVNLEQEALESLEGQAYWAKQLEGSTNIILPRWPPVKCEKPRICSVIRSLPPDLSEELKQLAQAVEIPLKSILLAAHLRVMSLLSNQTDVMTGLVSNGRPETTDGERVLGLFINTLPFRIILRGGTWLDLIRQTFVSEREIMPFRRFPLAELHKKAGHPLFETAFNFVYYHIYKDITNLHNFQILESSGFEETNFTLYTKFSQNPFTTELRLTLDYDASQLHNGQVQMMGDYYLNVLSAMVAHPNAPYRSQHILPLQEQQRLTVEWNDTLVRYTHSDCIHQLFESQARQTPDAIALIDGQRRLTYEELHQQSEQLAHYLQGQGVGPETRIGLCVERSVAMVVGLWGILKAGGAYVPLDPAYPRSRLSYMLADAQLALLLTQQSLLPELGEQNIPIVCLDTHWSEICQVGDSSPGALLRKVSLENLAYVIYTSGSTGNPKGVQITHRNVINFLNAMRKQPGITSEDIVLAITTLSFDIAVLELILPLIAGACVVLVDRDTAVDSRLLLEQLTQSKATIVQATPTTWKMLLDEGWIGSPDMKLLCGGERLPQDLAGMLRHRGASLWNLYGPTETTVWSTLAKVDLEQNPVLIGQPIDNTQIYLLDQNLNLVPTGSPGEIHIGGEGLARGYLNQPVLTAAKFIPNPFSHTGGERLYKTGDMARYLPGGHLEYIGRIDHQIKIRGFRVELREIERELARHPAVMQAVVTAREDGPNRKQLVAYWRNHPQQLSPGNKTLHNFLTERLPDYMIPAAFVLLEAFPRTPNGKIDRRALPPPQAENFLSHAAYAPPNTPIEKEIVSIWEQVLGIQPVGIHDSFFDLGGHSLLATQLVSRLREAFQIDLSVRDLFKSSTVANLALHIVHTMVTQSGESKELDELLASLEQISEEEARALLGNYHEIAGYEND